MVGVGPIGPAGGWSAYEADGDERVEPAIPNPLAASGWGEAEEAVVGEAGEQLEAHEASSTGVELRHVEVPPTSAVPGVRPHSTYSAPAVVSMVTAADDVAVTDSKAKLATLDQVIAASGFLGDVDAAWRASGKSKEEFAVAIKPNMMMGTVFDRNSPVYTNADAVEHLIGKLHEQGYRNLSVVETQNIYNYSFEDRSVAAVARAMGYSGRVPGTSEATYRIVDMTADAPDAVATVSKPEDFVSMAFAEPLGEQRIHKAWAEADYRISFAKNKTHPEAHATGTVKNTFGCLPQWDKMKHYHGKDSEFWQAATSLSEKLPVNFGFLDAWTSGDGAAGFVYDTDPEPTRSFVASSNIMAIDRLQLMKMGVDPMASPVVGEGTRLWGDGGMRVETNGAMEPWDGWENTTASTMRFFDFAEETYGLQRFLSRGMAASTTNLESPFALKREGKPF